MAKATMKLIQQLRAQLPPEAAEKLDDLESLAADEKPEEGDDMDDEVGAMYGAGDEAPSGDEEGSDEPADVNASAMDEGPTEEDEEEVPAPKAKKKAKKGLSFFG